VIIPKSDGTSRDSDPSASAVGEHFEEVAGIGDFIDGVVVGADQLSTAKT
jgi:hypothetical protein